jgi:hypothetical protein
MPYSSKKTGKNEITVYKKDSGEVIGHTTPEKYDDYMAALHIHSGDNAAEGGLVDDFSVNTGDSDTLKGMPIAPPVAPDMATNADPNGSGPKPATVTSPDALTVKASNPTALPGMPPDVTPDELSRYITGQKQEIEKYGPEQQLSTEQALIKARTGPGMSLANAGAGFADALMQGVARAGNPGFQEKLQGQENQMASEVSGAVKGAHETALQDVESSLKLDAKNPASPLSRAYQKSYAPTLIAAGIPRDQIQNMSGDLISDVAEKRITLADALARIKLENQYRMGELDLQRLMAGANITNQRAQRKEEAAKTLAGRGAVRRAVDALTGNPATKALEDEMTSGTTGQTPLSFDTEAEAAAAGLPDGTRVIIAGKPGTWRH